MNTRLIRSARRSLGLELNVHGLTIRAPYRMPESAISAFVESHRDWIEKRWVRFEAMSAQLELAPPISIETQRELAHEALRRLPERIAAFAKLLGVNYRKVTVRTMKSRWGSCATNGNLCFNALLMLAPPQVIDSVVAHELCHLLEPNHSARFYAHLYRVIPDYSTCDAWLKREGRLLIMRAVR